MRHAYSVEEYFTVTVDRVEFCRVKLILFLFLSFLHYIVVNHLKKYIYIYIYIFKPYMLTIFILIIFHMDMLFKKNMFSTKKVKN